MINELPDQNQTSEELPFPDMVNATEASHSHVPQVEQLVKGDRNQGIGQMSGGTAIGNVQGTVLNISGSSITNLTGEGDIHYQECSGSNSKPIRQSPMKGENSSSSRETSG